MESLKNALGEDILSQIEVVGADLTDGEAIDKAVEGCDYILHCASPLPLASPKNVQAEVIQPAIDGNKYVLKAAVKHKIQKIMVTSSCLTIMDQMKGDGDVDETQFCEINKSMAAYYISKIEAERYALKFIDQLDPKERTFDMSIINPGFIQGPTLLKERKGASTNFALSIFEGTTPGVPQIYLPFSDVRDVALYHLALLEKGRHGERYALTSHTFRMSDIPKVMQENFKDQGYSKIKNKELGKCMVWFASFFNADAKNFLWLWNVRVNIKNDKVLKEVPEVKPRKFEDSIVDMCNDFIEKGWVKPDKK